MLHDHLPESYCASIKRMENKIITGEADWRAIFLITGDLNASDLAQTHND